MPPDSGEPSPDLFPELIQSLRRWVLVLGLGILVLLLLLRIPRSILAGYCVGWFLSLFSLDHISTRARRLEQTRMSSGDAKIYAARTFLFRWLVLIGVIVLASRVGADPVAAVAGLLLLQAAIVCRSIMTFFGDDPPREDDPAG
jgi:hypothetical protein